LLVGSIFKIPWVTWVSYFRVSERLASKPNPDYLYWIDFIEGDPVQQDREFIHQIIDNSILHPVIPAVIV
jgi:ABC-type enterochelin transport system substrate-binding protein